MKDDSIYLQHILDSIDKIENYTESYDEQSFQHDTLVQDGVIRQIEIIGEAVKQLSTELKDKHIHVPWKDIAGMRDKLVHHYFGVDIKKVWLTVVEDIPFLKKEVLQIFDDLA